MTFGEFLVVVSGVNLPISSHLVMIMNVKNNTLSFHCTVDQKNGVKFIHYCSSLSPMHIHEVVNTSGLYIGLQLNYGIDISWCSYLGSQLND